MLLLDLIALLALIYLAAALASVVLRVSAERWADAAKHKRANVLAARLALEQQWLCYDRLEEELKAGTYPDVPQHPAGNPAMVE